MTIVSSDKDLMQLVEDGSVDMLDTMNDRRIDEAYVNEKFGVGPELVGDVLALMGDSVDNVPGVPGVGPKTATQLIQQFGDLDTVLASTDQITKPKLKQNLIDHADNARLSRELVRLVCDAPLPEPLEDLALTGIPPAAAAGIPRGAGVQDAAGADDRRAAAGSAGAAAAAGSMTSWRQLAQPKAPAAAEEIAIDRSAYETVTDEAALDRWIEEARGHGYVAVDTETDCIDCVIARLAGISLATAPNRACYIPVGHSGGGPLFRRAGPARQGAGAGEAEAAARGPGGAQDRAQFQI